MKKEFSDTFLPGVRDMSHLFTIYAEGNDLFSTSIIDKTGDELELQ